MKISSFWHYVQKVDKFWHSLNFTWVNASEELKFVFSKALSSNFDLISCKEEMMLNNFGFLSTKEKDDEIINEFLYKKKQAEIKSLYLIMSTKCNLRCSYCLYGPSQSRSLAGRGRHLMHREVYDALKLFQLKTSKNNRSEPDYWEQITFYGGEPLLNKAGLKFGIDLISQIKRKGGFSDKLKVIIDTNGTLIDDDFIDFVKLNNVCVQISIDGPQDVHDVTRRFKSGRGTFDAVSLAMKKLSKRKVKFLPLITVSPANIYSLQECVKWICEEYGVDEIAMNLLMYTGEDFQISYGSLAADAMLCAQKTAQRLGATDVVFDEVIERFNKPSIAPEMCGAGVKIAAFPGGGLHACQALENCGAGFLGQTVSFNEDCLNWQKWKKRSRFLNPECILCPALGFCGGGCAASAFVVSGNLNDIDPYYCQWLKRLFEMWVEKGGL